MPGRQGIVPDADDDDDDDNATWPCGHVTWPFGHAAAAQVHEARWPGPWSVCLMVGGLPGHGGLVQSLRLCPVSGVSRCGTCLALSSPLASWTDTASTQAFSRAFSFPLLIIQLCLVVGGLPGHAMMGGPVQSLRLCPAGGVSHCGNSPALNSPLASRTEHQSESQAA